MCHRRGESVPLVKTTAIVLRSRKWGDADRIVPLPCHTISQGASREQVETENHVVGPDRTAERAEQIGSGPGFQSDNRRLGAGCQQRLG